MELRCSPLLHSCRLSEWYLSRFLFPSPTIPLSQSYSCFSSIASRHVCGHRQLGCTADLAGGRVCLGKKRAEGISACLFPARDSVFSCSSSSACTSSFGIFPLLLLCIPVGFAYSDGSAVFPLRPTSFSYLQSFRQHTGCSGGGRSYLCGFDYKPTQACVISFFTAPFSHLHSLLFSTISTRSSSSTNISMPQPTPSLTSSLQRHYEFPGTAYKQTHPSFSSFLSNSLQPAGISHSFCSRVSSTASQTLRSMLPSYFQLSGITAWLYPPHFFVYAAPRAALCNSFNTNTPPSTSPSSPSSVLPSPQPNGRISHRSLCSTSSSSKTSPSPLHRHDVGVATYAANDPIEDRVNVSTIRTEDGLCLMATVMDGHGGWHIAEFVSSFMPIRVEEQMKLCSNVRKAITKAFLQVDDEIRCSVRGALKLGYMQPLTAGACALSMLVMPKQLVVANLGDCKAVMSRKGIAVSLNVQQNANNPAEQSRLRKEHPNENVITCANELVRYTHSLLKGRQRVVTYEGCYVKDLLNPTRSFGDFYLKEEEFQGSSPSPGSPLSIVPLPHSFPYISAVPQVDVYPRSAGDEFVVLATDGVWDVFSSQETVDIVRDRLEEARNRTNARDDIETAEYAANGLLQAAKQAVADKLNITLSRLEWVPPGSSRRQLHDDMSVCVVLLNSAPNPSN